jgi:hypothetical protein
LTVNKEDNKMEEIGTLIVWMIPVAVVCVVFIVYGIFESLIDKFYPQFWDRIPPLPWEDEEDDEE